MFLSGDVIYSKYLSGIARNTLYNKEGPIMPDVTPETHRIMENLLREYQEAAPSPCKLFLLSELSEKQLHTLLGHFEPPVFFDTVLGFLSTSLLADGKNGILFLTKGCYLFRRFSDPYYIEYGDLCRCTTSDSEVVLTLSRQKTAEFGGLRAEGAAYLQKLLLALKDCRPVGEHSVPGISGPVEDESFPFRRAHKAMLSLLSKDVYDRCSSVIDKASKDSLYILCQSLSTDYTSRRLYLAPRSRHSAPVQVSMILQLSKTLGHTLSPSIARSILHSYAMQLNRQGVTVLLLKPTPIQIGPCRYEDAVLPYVRIVGNTDLHLTAVLGWMFVYNYAVHHQRFFRKGNRVFLEKIRALTSVEEPIFAQEMGRLSGGECGKEAKKLWQFFWSISVGYALGWQMDVTELPVHYAHLLKRELKPYEDRIQPASQAMRYYKKFCAMEFSSTDPDFEKLTDFVELFLGFYNAARAAKTVEPVRHFDFDLVLEDPKDFLGSLYADEQSPLREETSSFQNPSKEDRNYHQKLLIHAWTSLLYSYAVAREKGEES